MPVFAVTAPHLTPDQHYELETLLLDVAGCDAFFNEEGALGTEVTCPVEALPAVVDRVFDWAASHERGSSVVQFICPGGAVAGVSDHTRPQVAAFLAACGEDPSALKGMTKRLADDGVHEGR